MGNVLQQGYVNDEAGWLVVQPGNIVFSQHFYRTVASRRMCCSQRVFQPAIFNGYHCRINCLWGNQEAAKEAAQAAFNTMDGIAALADRFAKEGSKAFEESDVCRINSMAGIKPVRVSCEVLEMVSMAKEYYEITGGAFDITIGPLMDLWGFGADPAVPEDGAVGEKLKLVDMGKVIVDEEKKTVYLSQKGMSIDLGGIAKGYAAERGAQVLREKGIKQGIINAGGNVVVLGEKRPKEPWKLGIQDPRDRSSLIGIVALNDQAAVTSGDYQRYLTVRGNDTTIFLILQQGGLQKKQSV